MASQGNLPEDMMMEILKRLPSDCVGRFKCVSKYWYALINDPKFADSLQHPNLLVKLTVIRNEESGEKQTMLTSLKFPLASAAVVDMTLPLSDHFQYCEFNGCYSRCLICLSNMLGNIYLCNPATGELRKLPPSILLTEPPEDPFDRNGTSTDRIGFGYDPKSMDFKVVRVVTFEEDGYLCNRTEVYDLGKDGWREIESRARGFVVPDFFGRYVSPRNVLLDRDGRGGGGKE
ncbi:F-box/kelch-repeat protein At3g06240-like [Momordica charantia]|uniref:F-box/kelch-repeat protein At3g06240-like n=1 Tax=Momordica charantia TaxID=3673 RepID=A0A6J1DD85_MOMCH|nr:F-box/kelch-repeat protein At3g06240-like [Momordica charantia]